MSEFRSFKFNNKCMPTFPLLATFAVVLVLVLVLLHSFKTHCKVIYGNVMCGGRHVLTPQVVRTPFMKRCWSYLVLDFQTSIQITLNAIGFSHWTCQSLMLSLLSIPFIWRHLTADRIARKSA